MLPKTKITCSDTCKSKSNPQPESVLEIIDTANKEETGIYATATKWWIKKITISQSESCDDVGLYFHQQVFLWKAYCIAHLKVKISLMSIPSGSKSL